MNSGEIYCIICNTTNKRYIGQAFSYIGQRLHGANGRWKKHVAEARSTNNNRCSALNNAIRKYGEHNFSVKTIHICEKKQLDYWETKYIRKFNTICPNGYNIRSGGARGSLHESSKEKLRKAKSGENNHMYGKHHTTESKEKISKSNSGKVRTAEQRVKISVAKGRKDIHSHLPMYVYVTKSKYSIGYRVKYHPALGSTSKLFMSNKYTMEEKLQQAIDFLKTLK